MEKLKRAYELDAIKRQFSKVENLGLSVTGNAFRNAQELGFSREDIVAAIQAIKPSDFYESMTSIADHRVWQDVYHVKFEGMELYVKFSVMPTGGFLLLSFKKR